MATLSLQASSSIISYTGVSAGAFYTHITPITKTYFSLSQVVSARSVRRTRGREGEVWNRALHGVTTRGAWAIPLWSVYFYFCKAIDVGLARWLKVRVLLPIQPGCRDVLGVSLLVFMV